MKLHGVFISMLLVISLNSWSRELAGVNVPESKIIDGETLPLHGVGLRTFTIFSVKVYVGAFYAPIELKEAQQIEESKSTLRLDLIFLRSFSAADVAKAWQAQLKESADFEYPERADDFRKLQSFLGALEAKEAESFVFTNGETRILDNETLKGSIPGTNFRHALLSIFFGSHPPSEKLKQGLLGGQ